MEFNLDNPRMVIMDGRTLGSFEYGSGFMLGESDDNGRMNMDIMLARLRESPHLAAELLSYPGTIVYAGRSAMDADKDGHTLGMKFIKGGTALSGDNIYGLFLMRVRDNYIKELQAKQFEEILVRPGQIVKDYVPAGEDMSYIERRENVSDSTDTIYVLDPSCDFKALHAYLDENGYDSLVSLKSVDGKISIIFNIKDEDYRNEVMGNVRKNFPFSETEIANDNGRTRVRYLHTEPYRPVRFRFDTGRDGTTGHAQRQSNRDVAFQTFECPFGIGYQSKVRVGSAAEASLLYEKALRKELDWKLLFVDLRSRQLVKNLAPSDEAVLIRDLKAQFAWMRDEICRNRHLADMPIVCDSLLVPDMSFGRTIYDAERAPSPAHILARYVNNPLLLFSESENGVYRALQMNDKNEPFRFSAVSGQGSISIVVDGSDTIGGRELNTRAVKERRVIYEKDERGKILVDQRGRPVIKKVETAPAIKFKSTQEIDSDYAAFSKRLDDILSNISPEVQIELVTGNGIGVPKMVHRYVRERGGRVFDWNYANDSEKNSVGGMIEERDPRVNNPRIRQLRMQKLDNVLPVLVGTAGRVSFKMNELDDDAVVFSNGEIKVKGFVEYSVSEDKRNSHFLDNGSLAVNAGVPTIHVVDNMLENEQIVNLAAAASSVRDKFIGEQDFEKSLFEGESRVEWDLTKSHVFSYVDDNSDIAIPEIAFSYDATVYVNSVPFHSVYGVYVALLAKQSGVTDIAYFKGINENSMTELSVLASRLDVTPEMQEKCMRNSVHMMAQASSVFADKLLSLDSGDVVCVSSVGGDVLFTDADGHGRNLFGIVVASERDALRIEMENIRKRQDEEMRKLAEANAAMIRKASTVRARGQKMSGGLPRSIQESQNAVWLFGAARPSHLCLPEGDESFFHWEETDYGKDSLNRELASRKFLDDGEGGSCENNLVFIFPSDELACTGRRSVMNNPDSKDLTGLKRVNPRTKEEFTCAYGIPVKRDDMYYEEDNKFGRACSFRSDKDSSAFYHSIIAADSLARTTAFRQGMALCYAKRDRNLNDGSENDDLGRVFIDKIWDYPRTVEVIDRNTGKTIVEAGAIMPKEVTRRVYNTPEKRFEYRTMKYVKKEWVDNPHAAPLLRSLLKKYEKILVEGADFPLNCICMPEMVYPEVLPDDGVHTLEQRQQMAEMKFLSDFNLTLNLANAAAINLDLPMNFPLDVNGRLDLGPDVPERFRDIAERKLDSFINVVREENIINDSLPLLNRIKLSDTVKNGVTLKSDGSDIYMRPNDLLTAFGAYDFHDVSMGMVVPLHEMAFCMEDGTMFRVVHQKLTKGMSSGEINRYLRYEKNDECRFTIKSSDPDKIPEFTKVLKSYIERAKRITIETRLLSEDELKDDGMPLDGFVRLLSSNSEQMALDPNEVSARGDVTGIEVANRFDGTDMESSYYGKEDAKDAFAGYAQFRYTLPDGTKSDWVTVTDRETAIDLVYSKVNRVYRSDIRVVPAPIVMDAELKAMAVRHAGDSFRSLKQESRHVEVDTKVVESERFNPDVVSEVSDVSEVNGVGVVEKKESKVYVTYYGSRNIPEDAIKVQISTSCPTNMKEDIDFNFKSLYPDYETMVKPHKDGKIDDAEYTRRYNEQVLVPNKEKILSGMEQVLETAREEGKDVYLYCYCKPGAFCHRYLVNNFLNENGMECQENPADRQMYRQGHVMLYGENIVSVHSESEAAEEMKADEGSLISFTCSKGGYSQRTRENANADDVDITFQFAVDFQTYGEVCTRNAAGDSLIPVALPVVDGKLQLNRKAVGEIVQQIVNMLPEDFVQGEPFGVNLAGNGLYTLSKYGVDQESLDVLLSAIAMSLEEKGVKIRSWRSGGQTGVDESASAIGQILAVPVTIHAPYDYAFRGVDGKDVKFNEKAFKARFDAKDYDMIKSKAEKLVSRKVVKKVTPGIN